MQEDMLRRLLVAQTNETRYTHAQQHIQCIHQLKRSEEPGAIMEKDTRKDFFISYTSADRTWAEWIARQLEQEGYTTLIQAWDFRPGSDDFVQEMDSATRTARRIIAVLSPD